MALRPLFFVPLLSLISIALGIAPAAGEPFSPPPERGAPSSTAGGGSRPSTVSCTLDELSEQRAIALAPQPFVGFTSQAMPNLWLYLPNNEVETIEISVFNEQLGGLAQFELDPPDSTGLLSIDLSERVTLPAGNPLYWTAAFVCDPNRRTEDWVIGGWIQYEPIEMSKQKELQVLSSMEQIDQYASSGYWYDALTAVLALAQTPPPSSALQDRWNHLIQQATIELNWADIDHVTTTSE